MAWLSRQFSTRVIVLIPIEIAINIVLGYTCLLYTSDAADE